MTASSPSDGAIGPSVGEGAVITVTRRGVLGPLPDVPGIRVAEAIAADVPAVVALLTDDPLGRAREVGVGAAAYDRAFAAIDADPREHLLVLLDEEDAVVGTLHLSYLASLSRGGALRAQIEAVRVSDRLRGRGVGRAFFRFVIERARQDGAALVQLTSDLQRSEAIRFYESLGFTHSHAGLKLALT